MNTPDLTPNSVSNYERWNRAFAEWAVQGAAEGTSIYLAVDEQALQVIARQFAHIPCNTTDDAVTALQDAIRKRCVALNNRVNVSGLQGTEADGFPRCVASWPRWCLLHTRWLTMRRRTTVRISSGCASSSA
jgi:hypothetical protein